MKINARQLNLYAVTDRSWLKPGETLVSVTEELLKAGVTCVQLREKHMSDEEILKEASLLKDLCDSYQVPLIINDRPDLAKKSGASGVHVGLSDMGIQKARKLLGEDVSFSGLTLSSAEVPIMLRKHLLPKLPVLIISDAVPSLEVRPKRM